MSKSKIDVKELREPKSLWNMMFLIVFYASAALNLSQQMSNSLLSLYAKSTGTPSDQIGSLTSVFAITALLFRFVSGPAMNSFDRKRLLQGAMVFYIVAYLGFGFSQPIADMLGISLVAVLRVFRAVQGVGQAFGNACLLAIVSDYIPKASFVSSMGIFACAQVVAQAIGPTVGVFLRDTVGYSTTFVISAVLMGSTLLLTSLLLRVVRQKPEPFRLTPKNMVAREAIVPAIITFLMSLGFTSINAFLLIYAEERGISGGSWFFTVYALTMLVTRPLIGKLSDKYGFVKIGIPTVCFQGGDPVKYYVTSDIHGFYTLFHEKLEQAGYFTDPEPHKLLILGDLFDRGKEARELQRFILDEMKENRVILIRGNHEDLFRELITTDGGWPLSHHVSNGTFSTALQLTGLTRTRAMADLEEFCERAWNTPYNRNIIPAMLDYYETRNFVFVHGWIPCIQERDNSYSYIENWRDVDLTMWQAARWINGMKAVQTCPVPGKTVVCGHWHASYGHSRYEGKGSEFGEDADFSPYLGNGIIAVDASTANSGMINCIILEDEEAADER